MLCSNVNLWMIYSVASAAAIYVAKTAYFDLVVILAHRNQLYVYVVIIGLVAYAYGIINKWIERIIYS